jgi:hypothetical protein
MEIFIGVIVAILVMYSFLSVFTSSYFGLVKTKALKHTNISFIRLVPNLIIPIVIAAVLMFVFFDWWVSVFVIAGVIALIGVVWSIYEKENRVGPLVIIMLGLAAALAAATTLAIMKLPTQLPYILMILGAAITSGSVFVFMLTPKQKLIGGAVLVGGLAVIINGLIILLSPLVRWEFLLLIVFGVSLLVNAIVPLFTKDKSPTHYYTLTLFMIGVITMTALVMNHYQLDIWIIIVSCIGLAMLYFLIISIPTGTSQKKSKNVDSSSTKDDKTSAKTKENTKKVVEPEIVDDTSRQIRPEVSANITNLVMAAITIAVGILLLSFGYVMIAITAVVFMIYLTFNANSLILKKYYVSRYWFSSFLAIAITVLLTYALMPYPPFNYAFYRILLTSAFYFLHILFIHIIYVSYKYNLLNNNLSDTQKKDETAIVIFVRRLRSLRDFLFPAAVSAFIVRISFTLYALIGNPLLATLAVAGIIITYALGEIIYHRYMKHMGRSILYGILFSAGVILLVITLFMLGIVYWIPVWTIVIGVLVSIVVFISILVFIIYLADGDYYRKKKGNQKR